MTEPTATNFDVKALLARLAGGVTLDEDEAREAIDRMTDGAASLPQMAAFLMALRVRGETVAEITGAARLLRDRMIRVSAAADSIDIVGTGGDGHETYNISTCAALIVAGTGVPVAKHGNRSVSSRSGASDVLVALGVRIDLDPSDVPRIIEDAGIAFLWAPMHHPAMKAWAPVRAELGLRTLFNLLGPICNPASVKRQVVGVYDRRWVVPIADTLRALGSERCWVVHGHDGLDELSTTGPTTVASLIDGKITSFEVTPEEAGLKRVSLADLKGGDATTNAAALRAVLDGARNAYRDIAVINAAAALVVADKATDIGEGARMAEAAIDGGHARNALDRLIAVTNATRAKP
ncbi:MAG: anthranilate phosphoribosyltransferase [Hyphomicrobium sp.]|nr:anthranilate phosphoribosyltransferase [Hyphomicrobium sp.]